MKHTTITVTVRGRGENARIMGYRWVCVLCGNRGKLKRYAAATHRGGEMHMRFFANVGAVTNAR